MKHFVIIFVIFSLLTGCSGGKIGDAYDDAKRKYKAANPVTKSAVTGSLAGAAVGGLAGASFPVALAAGAVVGGAIGDYLAAKESEVRKLQGMGVYFIHLGDNVMIVIPSNALFIGFSDRFTDTAYTTLDVVRDILSGITKISIKVAAFTPNPEQSQADILLSQRQALKVNSYLFSDANAVDARFVYAKGYGSGHPVLFDHEEIAGVNLNYRIEITLMDLTKAKSEI